MDLGCALPASTPTEAGLEGQKKKKKKKGGREPNVRVRKGT